MLDNRCDIVAQSQPPQPYPVHVEFPPKSLLSPPFLTRIASRVIRRQLECSKSLPYRIRYSLVTPHRFNKIK